MAEQEGAVAADVVPDLLHQRFASVRENRKRFVIFFNVGPTVRVPAVRRFAASSPPNGPPTSGLDHQNAEFTEAKPCR